MGGAIQIYREISDSKVIRNRRNLLIADVFHRAGLLGEAVSEYRVSINHLSSLPDRSPDEEYMLGYGQYFLDITLSKGGQQKESGVFKADVKNLGSRASRIALADFPIP